MIGTTFGFGLSQVCICRSSAVVNPANLGILIAGYDAAYGLTIGTGVTSWAPKWGAHVGDSAFAWQQSTAGYQPILATRSDGKPEIRADGIDDFMTCPALGAAFPSASFTVIVAGRLVCSSAHPYGCPVEFYNSTGGTTGGEPSEHALSILSNDVVLGSVRAHSGSVFTLHKDVSGMAAANTSRHTAAVQKVGSLWTIQWGAVNTTATDSGVNAAQSDSAVLFKRMNSWPGDIAISGLWIYSGAVTDLSAAKAAMQSLYPDLAA